MREPARLERDRHMNKAAEEEQRGRWRESNLSDRERCVMMEDQEGVVLKGHFGVLALYLLDT